MWFACGYPAAMTRGTLLRGGIALALTLLLASAATAWAIYRGVYTGGSKPGNRHMDIALQILKGGHRANWRIDVYGPCTEHEQLSRTVGTDAGNSPPDPQLRIHAGHFRLRRRATNPNNGLKFSYLLVGRAVRGGFTGTFHYEEHQGAYRCNSKLLHWRAHRSQSSFP